MQKLKNSILATLSVFALALAVAPLATQPASAAVDVFKQCTSGNSSDTAICEARDDKLFGPNSIWTNIINTLIFVTGAVSVLMIVIGGLRYSISGGDQGAINSAKNTILYAVIGLVVSLLGYAVVNFVLSAI